MAHDGEVVLDQGVIDARAEGSQVLAMGGEVALAPHQLVEHPERVSAAIVDDALVARQGSVHLDQRPLGIALPGVPVAVLDLLAERDALLEAARLLGEQNGREVRHALREHLAARALARHRHAGPPLVGGLVRGDPERGVRLRLAPGEEPDVLREGDVGGRSLRVTGEARELRQLELFPRIGCEPLAVPAPRGDERLEHLVHVVRVSRIVVDGDAVAPLHFPAAEHDVERSHR